MDLYMDWNSDFVLSQNGSLQTAVGWDQVRQRIIRRMVTNPSQRLPNGVFTPADYIYEPDFGFGLGSLVDGAFTEDFLADLQRRINQAVFADDGIVTTIPPSVRFQAAGPGQLWVIIGVTLLSGEPGQISIKVT